MMEDFEIVRWPDVQKYMELEGFYEHSSLIEENDFMGIGDCTYLIDKEWIRKLHIEFYKDKYMDFESFKAFLKRMHLFDIKGLYVQKENPKIVECCVFNCYRFDCENIILYKKNENSRAETIHYTKPRFEDDVKNAYDNITKNGKCKILNPKFAKEIIKNHDNSKTIQQPNSLTKEENSQGSVQSHE